MTVRAFDVNWLVPGSWYQTTGSYLTTLCNFFEFTHVLNTSHSSNWFCDSSPFSSKLRRLRPTLRPDEWRQLEQDKKFEAATVTGGRRYYIYEDVMRHLPPAKPCLICGCPENEWEELASFTMGRTYYSPQFSSRVCSDKCNSTQRRKDHLRWLAQERNRKQLRTAQQKLKEVRAFLKGQRENPSASW